MKYRENKKTKDKISEIGFGSAYIFEAGFDTAVKTIRHAYESGINYFDMAAGDEFLNGYLTELFLEGFIPYFIAISNHEFGNSL